MARKNPVRPLPAGSFEEHFNTGVLDPAKWTVSEGTGQVGTNATNNGVFDADQIDLSYGMLRLKLSQTGPVSGVYTSTGAELRTVDSFGYGTYDFVARMSSTASDPRVLGVNKSGTISALFNYNTDSETEIDFELEGLDDRRNLLEMTSWYYAGIQYIGQATGTTSATLPTHKEHDIIIGFAYRYNSATPPTAPAGWTLISSTGASTTSFTCAWKKADAAGTSSGTWTNATSVCFQVYRGADKDAPIGAYATNTGSSSTATYSAITLDDSNWQLPWVVAFGGSASSTSIQNAPTGLTARSNHNATGEAAGFDSDGELDTWTAQTVSLGSSVRWQTITLELNRQRNENVLVNVENLYTGFNCYRFVWTPSYIEYYVNGKLLGRNTDVIPKLASPIYINHWGTNNVNFGGVATPDVDRYMYVSYVRFVPYEYQIGEAWPVGTATPLPSKVLATYFTAWDAAFDIDTVPTTYYNQIYLFHATPKADGTGAFEFLYDYNVTQTQIQAARTAGHRVVLSCGGWEAGFSFTNRNQSKAFVESFQQMYTDFGPFDGCDFNNYEGGLVSSTTEMIWISDQLKRLYGSNFSITTPPYPVFDDSPNDQYMVREWLESGTLDYVAPQCYSGTNTEVQDQCLAWIGVAEAAGKDASYVVFGMGANIPSGRTPANNATAYNAVEASKPLIRGAFGWNTQYDEDAGWTFASTMDAAI